MAGLNKCQIIGHLGNNPEVKTAQSGLSICNFSVATSESWIDKGTGQKTEKTEWHKITAFGKLADICGKYLAKGKQVYVEGKLQTTDYEKDGQKHYTTKIIADNVIFLGSADGGNGQGNQQQSGGYQPQTQAAANYKPLPPKQPAQQSQQDMYGDVPF